MVDFRENVVLAKTTSLRALQGRFASHLAPPVCWFCRDLARHGRREQISRQLPQLCCDPERSRHAATGVEDHRAF